MLVSQILKSKSDDGVVTVPPGTTIARAAESADMATLRRLTFALFTARKDNPKTWNAIVAAGAPQAILSRRLVLAGKEQPVGEGAP